MLCRIASDESDVSSSTGLAKPKVKHVTTKSAPELDPAMYGDTIPGVTHDRLCPTPKLLDMAAITAGGKSFTELLYAPSKETVDLKSRESMSRKDERYPTEYAASKFTDVKHVKVIVETILGGSTLSEETLHNLQSQFLAQVGAALIPVLRSSSSTDRKINPESLLDIEESYHSACGSFSWSRKFANRPLNKCRPFTPPKIARTVPSHVVRAPVLPKRDLKDLRENLTSLLRSRLARRTRERESESKKRVHSLEMEKHLEEVDHLQKMDWRQQLEQTLMAETIRARKKWDAVGVKERRAKVRIIVVGAGLAGLSATAELLRQGFRDITLLEASDRVGGRLHSVCLHGDSDDHLGEFPPGQWRELPVFTPIRRNRHAELGAPAWVNVDPTHSVFSLAKDQGLIYWAKELTRPQCRVMKADGKQLNERFVSSALRFCAHTERDTQILASNQHGRSSLAYSDYNRVRRRHLMAGVSKSEERDLALAVDSIATVWRFASGDDKGDMAADLRGQYALAQADMAASHDIEIPSETTSPSVKSLRRFSNGLMVEHKRRVRRFPIARTTYLCATLMRLFPPDMVRYEQRVRLVDWSKFCNRVAESGEIPKVRVVCDNGKVRRADHVIMAVPLGHLKRFSGEMFQPALPEYNLTAIDKVGIGTVSKIVLHYIHPPWRAPFHLVWAGRKPGEAGYDPDSLSSRCLQVLTTPGTLHVLEVTFLDDFPAAAATDDSHIATEISIILEHLMSTSSLAPRGYGGVPPPDKIVRSSWGSDPLFLGSHPYLKRGCDSKDTTRIANPVTFRKRPVIQFAGDHTWCDLSRLTHGARESGIREAKRLANFYNDYFGYENTNPFCSDKLPPI